MLTILGFIAVIIAAYFIYKTAKDTNRNAVASQSYYQYHQYDRD